MPLPADEPDIPLEDGTPTLAQQCETNGWEFGFYDFGKGDDGTREFFNPGLVERPDGIWLLARVSQNHDQYLWGVNSVYAFQLDETGKIPKVGHKLIWPDSQHNEQHEDARAVYFPKLDQTAVCCTNFIWYDHFTNPPWTGALQVLGFFDAQWECKIKHRPPIGGNPTELRNIDRKNYEKSWMPFFVNDRLHIFYSCAPWRIFSFGNSWEEHESHKAEPLTWAHGVIRNGTPPVLVDGEFISFFHSSLPWRGNYRRYMAGAVAFEAKPPFKPLRITPSPLLSGSQNDVWTQRKPPCVFPCGAILRNGTWLVSAGVNDLKSCWIEMSHESLLSRLEPITKTVTPIFPPTGLSKDEQRKQDLRARAAKARQVLAEKRARGEITFKPRKKLRRKRKKRLLKAA